MTAPSPPRVSARRAGWLLAQRWMVGGLLVVLGSRMVIQAWNGFSLA